ncbi:glutamate 5-kinase, partial [Halobacillus sp. BAB-2008]
EMEEMIGLTEPELESYEQAAIERKDFVCHLEVALPVGV